MNVYMVVYVRLQFRGTRKRQFHISLDINI